ncbi:MAG: hypothetical protein H0S82_04240 [Anaerolineaceae bacterium]|nr:hypothetical protein [Anaerolineaceae bacterium]
MFNEIHYYKPNLEEVIQRYKDLYAATGPGHAIIYTIPAMQPGEPVPPLNTIDFDNDMEDYLDLCLRNFRAWLEVTRELPDDLLPSFGPNFGIGDYSGFVAGEVVFTVDTSWAAPVLESLDQVDQLRLSEDNYWVRMMKRAMTHLMARTASSPIPLVRGYYSPLDMAHALRGEKLFTDFMDEPEKVHRLMAFCAEAIIWQASRIRAIHGLYWGGNIAGAWLNPGTICMSEDIACMISPRLYTEFARPYTQKVIDAFGYGQIHTHSLGVRVIPEISQLRNLLGIQIAEDPNTPRTVTRLDWLLPRSHNVPLNVHFEPEEVKELYDEITSEYNIIFAVMNVGIAEGQDLIKWVRSHH